ncbi:hypothetical protein BT96DRAFT_714449 [Gymnopus androsaceus JB14]|uniref:Uncharacterized protein n=1 Tax=Gymnopus androsaceus JB14 TaxID=1447944 RepID=A0A6A4HMC9_9AGAR|nr:hypothetical protein BT96DRAFT_714449 [Gymnopus androsaceus JB14]
MFNIGSQSPGDSPSNTDLSTSSQANTKSISPLAGEIKTKLVSPPAGPLTRVRTQGHLLSRPTLHPQQPPPPPVLAKTNNSSPRQPRRLPHATANLSEAEAMIQAPRTKKVVLSDDDEDDDDWDETETDLDSDFEELDRKSHIDAEKGGTLVEPGMLATGSGDNDENGDWEDEDGSGSDDAVSAAPRNAKKNVASPPPAAANNQNPKRPGPSRHQSQPNIPTLASISKPKQQVIVEQESMSASSSPCRWSFSTFAPFRPRATAAATATS